MENIAAIQRLGASVSVISTTSVGGLTTIQIATMGSCEIANLSTTGSAAFTFTAIGATPTAATTAARTIPPMTVLTELLPQGATNASAISTGVANVTVVFTPIKT